MTEMRMIKNDMNAINLNLYDFVNLIESPLCIILHQQSYFLPLIIYDNFHFGYINRLIIRTNAL